MNQNKLQERLTFVKATPLKDRASLKVFSRRETAAVQIEEEQEDVHETFFDFEEELSEMRPSASQYNEMINSDPYIVMEEDAEVVASQNIDTETTYVIMEDTIGGSESAISMTEVDSKPSNGFKFIRCEQIKSDGIRCKRQAKKNETLCAAHRKMLNKSRV